MSKVFKSSYVRIGSPKPLEHVFPKQENPKVHEDAIEEIPVVEAVAEENYEEISNSIIEEAKQLYLKIIEEANLEAKQIVDNAHQDAANIRENERQAGFNEGFNEGRNQAQQIIDEATEIREYTDNRKEEMVKELEEQIIGLVLDISRKVLGEELKQNREAIFSLISEGLQRCTFRNKLTIRVSQEDYEFVMERKDRVGALVEGISELEIVPDLSMEAGGCVIETPAGEINSSIDVQLKELEKAFSYVTRNE